jgi:hypothetical protein
MWGSLNKAIAKTSKDMGIGRTTKVFLSFMIAALHFALH